MSSALPRKVYILIIISSFILGILTATALIYSTKNNNTINAINKAYLTINEPVIFNFESFSPFIAPKGEQFVVINVSVVNNSSADLYFAPVIQTYITDIQGNRYYMTPATIENPINAGVIKTGLMVNGNLSFLIPEKIVMPLIFNFYPNINNAISSSKVIQNL